MSTFATLFAASAAPELMRQFSDADNCVYVAPDGERTTLSAIVGEISASDRMVGSMRDRDQSREVERKRRIRLPRTAAIATAAGGSAGYIASPKTTATIEAAGSTWAIREILDQTEAFTSVLVVEIGALDRTRSGYRR